MQTGSSRKQWFIAARIRNKLMHMLVGNTPKHKSWRQTHRIQENILKIGSLNVGGVQQSTKRQRINCLDLEIIVLSETHLQPHLEHSESHLFQSFVLQLGPEPRPETLCWHGRASEKREVLVRTIFIMDIRASLFPFSPRRLSHSCATLDRSRWHLHRGVWHLWPLRCQMGEIKMAVF
jgi:hypothetical protein